MNNIANKVHENLMKIIFNFLKILKNKQLKTCLNRIISEKFSKVRPTTPMLNIGSWLNRKAVLMKKLNKACVRK